MVRDCNVDGSSSTLGDIIPVTLNNDNILHPYTLSGSLIHILSASFVLTVSEVIVSFP